jgi:hypothetical protein
LCVPDIGHLPSPHIFLELEKSLSLLFTVLHSRLM